MYSWHTRLLGILVAGALVSTANARADGDFSDSSVPTSRGAHVSRHDYAPASSFGGASAASLNNGSEHASAERMQAALGHYSRARTLLVDALAEFEQARGIARPDLLLDAERWRSTVIDRTQELDHLLDPQPRITTGGARFRANPLILKREKARTSIVTTEVAQRRSAPAAHNAIEKEQLSLENTSRARLASPKAADEDKRSVADKDGAERQVLTKEAEAADKEDLPTPKSAAKAKPADRDIGESVKKLSKDSELEAAVEKELEKASREKAGEASSAAKKSEPSEISAKEIKDNTDTSKAVELPSVPKPDKEDGIKHQSAQAAGESADAPEQVEAVETTTAKNSKNASLSDEEIRERLKKLGQEFAAEEQKKAGK